MSIKVGVCKSCVRDSGTEPEDFRASLQTKLQKEAPEISWATEVVPCQRICPDHRIVFEISASDESVRPQRTMAREATLESVATECLRIASTASKP